MEALLEQLEGLTTKLSSLSIEQLQQVCGQLELETDDLADEVNGRLRLVRSDDGGLTLLQTVSAVSKPKGTSPAEPPKTSTDSKALSLLHREFTIAGQIGEPGQKDRFYLC